MFDSDCEKVGLDLEIEEDARGWMEATLIVSLIIGDLIWLWDPYPLHCYLGTCMAFIWGIKRKWRVGYIYESAQNKIYFMTVYLFIFFFW